MPRVLLESKRLGNLACEFFLTGWGGGGGEIFFFCFFGGFLGTPGVFLGF